MTEAVTLPDWCWAGNPGLLAMIFSDTEHILAEPHELMFDLIREHDAGLQSTALGHVLLAYGSYTLKEDVDDLSVVLEALHEYNMAVEDMFFVFAVRHPNLARHLKLDTRPGSHASHAVIQVNNVHHHAYALATAIHHHFNELNEGRFSVSLRFWAAPPDLFRRMFFNLATVPEAIQEIKLSRAEKDAAFWGILQDRVVGLDDDEHEDEPSSL
eukprot:TRINITY_DN7398_c0_g2_i1.p1 TRINITY_DN7398_c0_g2~~TRINITY_DN7398_c0_g2_i1.p1  ORF type:complete len:213 (+),score=36.12 TRINITY_DN7398_c0_g2_i1:403-1041(+)